MSTETIAELIDPPRRSDELTMLTDFVDFFRTVLLRKARGLTPEQLGATLASSTLTIGALIRHMTFVEDHWFDHTFVGLTVREPWASADWDTDSDWEMTTAIGMSYADLSVDFQAACDRSRAHVSAALSLDSPSIAGDTRDPFSLRWLLIHMIEEYARHCGHADLIRESIDGIIGD